MMSDSKLAAPMGPSRGDGGRESRACSTSGPRPTDIYHPPRAWDHLVVHKVKGHAGVNRVSERSWPILADEHAAFDLILLDIWWGGPVEHVCLGISTSH
jgi:hypothetical protein